MSVGLVRAISRWIERRSSLATPPAWLIEALGGGKSASGVAVSETSALKSTAVFGAVDILSRTLASLPLPVYRRLQPRGKERAPEHPLYALLHDAPNAEMTSFEFRQALMGHLPLWGNAYAEIERDNAGRALALWPLRPDRMTLTRDGQGLLYLYRLSDGAEVGLRQDRVWHLRGLSSDGRVGYPPIRLAREAVGLSLATEEFGARFFGNGSRPGGVLEHPGRLGDDATKRLKSSWESVHGGLSNAHRIAILEEGLTWKQIGIPPEDAQFLETRKFQVSEIARLFHVPLHMLADLDRATFGNIEHQSIEFVVHTMRPWLVCWEQSIARALFSPNERREYFAEFLVDGLLRGDTKSRYEAYSVGRTNGWLSANDIREMENQNPLPGDQGDIYLVPLNTVPADQVREKPQAQPSQAARGAQRGDAARKRADLAEAHLPLFRATLIRLYKAEAAAVMKEARREFGKRGVSEFGAWLSAWYDEHRVTVEEQTLPIYRAFAKVIADDVRDELEEDDAPDLGDFAAAYAANYAGRHVGESLVAVREVMEQAPEGARLDALQTELDRWRTDRAAERAHEETNRAANAVAKAAYVMLGVFALRWHTLRDSCPYCRRLNGKRVGISKNFLEAGQDLAPDGEGAPMRITSSIGHPPAHRGCDCFITAGL